MGDPRTVLAPLGLVCDPCAGTPAGFSPAKTFPATARRLCVRRFRRREDGTSRPAWVSSANAFARTTSTSARARSGPISFRAARYNGNVASINTTGVGDPAAPHSASRDDGLAGQQYDADDLFMVCRRAAAVARQVRPGPLVLRQSRHTPDGPAAGKRAAGRHLHHQPESVEIGQLLQQRASALSWAGAI